MTSEFILKQIESRFNDIDLIVLKGFLPEVILNLQNHYLILDKYIYINGKIDLERINPTKILQDLLSLQRRAICSIESFIAFCNCVSDTNILPQKIGILVNNLLSLYPNPTLAEIPDFDSADFENSSSENPYYSAYYSLCIHERGEQLIQYIDNYSARNSSLHVGPLISPSEIIISKSIVTPKPLSVHSELMKNMLRKINDFMDLPPANYLLTSEEKENPIMKIFAGAVKTLKLPIRFFETTEETKVEVRSELYDILETIWGYKEFRYIKIYQNLFLNKEIREISQGEIIETIIRQAEYALEGNNTFHNVLLTAPTGAGKSLLFQMSAIYLAEKYNSLTIIISPLVALMEDQVEGLRTYPKIAALNRNKSASEREKIMEGIKNDEVNLLYLSPELFLSYNISFFIGERRLGLLVIDEAHTVTTWGRDFRVDYWFMGDYIQTIKRNLGYSFPIFALTATAVWDPSRKNDMIFDTIDSLHMDPCIKYIGNVRRNNISFDIQQSNIITRYEERRLDLTINRIKESLLQGRKTIVYCPFRKIVNKLKDYATKEGIDNKLAFYHSQISKADKFNGVQDFRNGIRPIMCATKAFGMGIDVSDITEIYHHAPTGCLSDYIQEIGRLARDPNIKGIAKIDFSEYDFRYIRKLHGLSTIKTYQLQQVLRKLMALYRLNGERRNLLISADEFAYIFPRSEKEDLDSNIKSSLLLLSHDLKNKLNFDALIVRPKSLFTKSYISVPFEQVLTFERVYKRFLTKIEHNLYVLDANKLWVESYSNISFPAFKFKMYQGDVFKNFEVQFRNRIKLELNYKKAEVERKLSEFFRLSEEFLSNMACNHKRLSFSDLKSQLPKGYSSLEREQFIETFRAIYEFGGKLEEGKNYVRVFSKQKGSQEHNESFQLISHGYESRAIQYIAVFIKYITNEKMEFYCPANDLVIALCEILSSLGLADYQKNGGDMPSIFVRINNPNYMNKLASKDRNYQNTLLDGIYRKYQYSERIFTYFFTTKMSDKQRWDFIESYFLGESEDRLLNYT